MNEVKQINSEIDAIVAEAGRNELPAGVGAWAEVQEVIDESFVEDAAKDVELEIACSPVMFSRISREPSECTALDGGRYRVYFDGVPYDVSESAAKRMRARFLLLRGQLYRLLPKMDPEQRARIERLWFGGGVFVPVEGSMLWDVMQTGKPLSIDLEGRDPIAVLLGVMRDAGAGDCTVVPVKQPEPVLPKREPEIYAAVEMPAQGSRHLVAFDVPSLRRIFYGMQKGEGPKPGAVVEATCKELARMLRARQSTHGIFAFEGEGSIREEESDEYKATRKPSPPELVRDEQAVKDILIALSAPVYAPHGFEADDVLAAAAKLCRGLSEEEKMLVVVMTPDKDMGQIVDDPEEVMLWDGAKGGNVTAAIGAAQILKRWKVPPWRLGDLLALAGDEGDGISGVSGWGPAKAAELLNYAKDKTLAEMLRPGGYWWVMAKYRKVFLANTERIRVCRELVRLRDECLPDLTVDALRVNSLELAEKLIEEGRRYAKDARA